MIGALVAEKQSVKPPSSKMRRGQKSSLRSPPKITGSLGLRSAWMASSAILALLLREFSSCSSSSSCPGHVKCAVATRIELGRSVGCKEEMEAKDGGTLSNEICGDDDDDEEGEDEEVDDEEEEDDDEVDDDDDDEDEEDEEDDEDEDDDDDEEEGLGFADKVEEEEEDP